MRIFIESYYVIFFHGVMPLLNLGIWPKLNTTGTVCQHNSSETAQQNFLKLSSNEGHNV